MRKMFLGHQKGLVALFEDLNAGSCAALRLYLQQVELHPVQVQHTVNCHKLWDMLVSDCVPLSLSENLQWL